MKKALFTLLLFTFSLFACTGDCLTCHPALVPTINEDERHKPMLTCIECHSPEVNTMSECGSDCFACHPIDKIEKNNIKEHRIIRGCRDCHVQLKKEMLQAPLNEGQSTQKPLSEFLLQ